MKELKTYSPVWQVTPDEEKLIHTIRVCSQDLKMDAFLIGGYIRDKILQRPVTDVDVMVVGSGIQFAEALAARLKPDPDLAVYKNFGTAMIQYPPFQIEVVGARKESYRLQSRKPLVEDGTLADDLARRDFTINALAQSLRTEDFGMVLDAFDGMKDLQARLIRTPLDPELTFSDDPLRMLRAIRFATQLQFRIDPQALLAIGAMKERIQIISPERVTEELNKILLSDKPSIGFDHLFTSGLLKLIFPELEKLYGVAMEEGKGHKENFYHTLQVLDNVAARSNNLWLRWAALLHDIAKTDTKKFEKGKGWTFHNHEVIGSKKVPSIFRRMHLPLNEHMRYVQKLVFLHLRPISLAKDGVTDSALRRLLFESGNDLEDLMILCEADITSKNEKKVNQYLENFKRVRQLLKEVEEKDKLRNWQPPITGEIIMKTFQQPPGKKVGILKDKIRDAILDGKIANNYQEAYTFMIEAAKEFGWFANEKT